MSRGGEQQMCSAPAVLLPSFKNNAEYSDLTIICKSRTWHAHRIVVSSQSEFFRAALGGSFKEARTRVITLNDDDLDEVESMLSFFYTNKYELLPTSNKIIKNPLARHAAMYAMGDKFGSPALKTNVVHKVSALFDTGTYTLDDLFSSTKAVWSTTPSSDIALRNRYAKELWRKGKYDNAVRNRLLELFKTVDGLAMDMLKYELQYSN